MEDQRIVDPNAIDSEEIQVSRSLLADKIRPQKLNHYIGQAKNKEKLELFIQAAKQREEPLDHVLLAGPPGLGKTTLANIVANEMGSQLHTVTGPNVEKKGDLAAVLTNLSPNDVLFVDEVHRLPRSIEELLYSAMEDFKLDLIVGQGPAARTIQIDLPSFTLVGATTRSGLLTGPLRDRFGVHLRLDFYETQELEKIVQRSAEIMDITIDQAGCAEVSRRSRGTPRIANRLLKRVRDYAQVQAVKTGKKPVIDQKSAAAALKLFDVDELGLDLMDQKFLKTIIEKFDGGPVGIETLCASLGEERETLEEVYEPYLLQQGLLQRTPRGRIATQKAYQHFGVEWTVS